MAEKSKTFFSVVGSVLGVVVVILVFVFGVINSSAVRAIDSAMDRIDQNTDDIKELRNEVHFNQSTYKVILEKIINIKEDVAEIKESINP